MEAQLSRGTGDVRRCLALAFCALIASAGVSRAAAQACLGHAEPLSTRTFVAGLLAEIGHQYQSGQLKLTAKKSRGVLGAVTIGATRINEGRVGLVIGGEVGYSGFPRLGRGLESCLFGGVLHDRGLGPTTDYRVGMSVAYPLRPTSSSRFTPVATLTVNRQNYTFNLIHSQRTVVEWYGTMDLGMALRIGRRWSLTPGVRLFVAYAGGRDPSVLLNMNLGM